jgi:hypothetical protein
MDKVRNPSNSVYTLFPVTHFKYIYFIGTDIDVTNII